MKKNSLLKLTYSALCLALAVVLPSLTGSLPQIGAMLCPMHIPALLCGFLCGWQYGLAVGAAAPLLRSLAFGGMPPLFPTAVGMSFELAAYGCLAGLLFRLLPKRIYALYLSLLLSMLGGRIVWGAVRFALAGLTHTSFPFSAFLAGAITNALPGIAAQILLIPPIILALTRAKLVPSDDF